MYTNADQFLNKKDDLLQLISGNEPHIIMITEVIPKRQTKPIGTPQIKLDGYQEYINFDRTPENLGSSGIRGVVIC